MRGLPHATTYLTPHWQQIQHSHFRLHYHSTQCVTGLHLTTPIQGWLGNILRSMPSETLLSSRGRYEVYHG
jgi:hypothetical protein